MGDISEHFNRSEFACQCGCGFDTVDIGLIEALEEVRHHFMAPITVTSGCRCVTHNADIGGSYDSQHAKGRAADIKVQGETPEAVHNFLCRMHLNSCGIGLYDRGNGDGWVHIDSRSTKGRWNG